MILVGVSKKIRMMLTSSSFQAEWIERTVQLWWDLKEQFMQKRKWCHCLLALGSFKPACCWFFLIHRLKKETKQWLKGTIHVMHTNCVVFQVMWKDWYLHCYSLKTFLLLKLWHSFGKKLCGLMVIDSKMLLILAFYYCHAGLNK